MAHQPMEKLELFRLFEEVADWAWEQATHWDGFAKNTLGDQLVRAIDSVGANLVEGDGRYSDADALRFFVIARASAREARLWIQRAAKRGLIETLEATAQLEKLVEATKLLNLLINYRRSSTKSSAVHEEREPYDSDESF